MSKRGRFLLLCLLVWASPVWAATYYVSTTGSDLASCELATGTGSPKQHITGAQGGLACLSAGDTLYLRGGTYAESINSNEQTIPSGTSWSNPVTMASYPGEMATLDSSGGVGINFHAPIQYFVFDRMIFDGGATGGGFSLGGGAHHIRIQHSEIRHSSHQGLHGSDCAGGESDYQILNNIVHSNGNDGFLDHGIYAGVPNMIIDGNELYQNSNYGIQIYSGNCGGVNARGSIIRNNRIHDNKRDGFSGGGGIVLYHCAPPGCQVYNNVIWNHPGGIDILGGNTGVQVWNNTIHNVTGTGYVMEIGPSSANTEIKNNIFSQYNVPLQDTGSGTTFGANLCTGTGTGCSLTNSSPGFASSAGSDFHIASGSSPAVGAGANLSGNFTTDAEGASRPGSGAWTIGAYEFGGTVEPPVAGPVGTVQAVWHLNAGQGTVAGDSVGEHHGAFSPNGGWVAGVRGPSAGSFDGTRSLVVPNVSGLRSTASKTLSAWVKMSATQPNGCEVVSDGDSTVLRVNEDGSLSGFFYDGSGWQFVDGGGGLLDDTWHHALWTYDSLEQTVWADGTQVGADAQTNPIDYTRGPTLIIGSHGDGGVGHECTGAIDEVTVLDGWCSPACVANLYANKDRRARRLVGSAP